MSTAIDLSAPIWTVKLVRDLERAASALARLDARVAASPVATAWRERAAWTGYAAALRGQGGEIDEIDIFARSCDITIPGRRTPPTITGDIDGLAGWLGDLRDPASRHWQDATEFSTQIADDWRTRPTLLRALELLSRHARADPSAAPWLAFPRLLQSMEITATRLPCIVPADKALRFAPRQAEANIARYLRQVTDASKVGLERLKAMEDFRLRAAAISRDAHRPGKLADLLVLLQTRPVISPRVAAQKFGIGISGAGKLLARATDSGLLIEFSGRQAWRTYIVSDLAYAFGLARRPAGRPTSVPQFDSPLDPYLRRFDAEIAELDATLARLGVSAQPSDDEFPLHEN